MSNSTPQPHKWAEVIKAWADGHAIQWRWNDTGAEERWQDNVIYTTVPDFSNTNKDWRVKPQAKTGWINIYAGGWPEPGSIFMTAEEAKQERDASRVCIACIQITYTEGEGLTP